MRLRRDEPHLVGDAELVDERVRPGELRLAVGAARPADDHKRDVGVVERGEAAHREPAVPSAAGCARRTASTRRPSRPSASRAPRRGRPARTSLWSTPGATISMRSGSASYSDASCARSSSVDASIRSAHAIDLVLGARAQLGIVVDAGVGLHARERVERRDERKIELVLQPVRDRAREPVVRVQHVDWRRLDEHARSAASTNGSTRSRSVVLRDRRARAGRRRAARGIRARPSTIVRLLGRARRACRRRTRRRPRASADASART